MKTILFALCLSAAAYAAPVTVAIPIDVLRISHDNRDSLLSIHEKATAKAEKPLDEFWRAWNQSAFRKASAALLITQESALKQITPGVQYEFTVVTDSATAIAKVTAGELATAWLRGDVASPALETIVEGHSVTYHADDEDYVFVARKADNLGGITPDRIRREGLKLGYPNLPVDALKPLREAKIDPFPDRGSLGPYVYVRQYYYGEDGIEALIRKDVDLAAVEPGEWRYYVSLYPGRSRWVAPVTTTQDFVTLARVNENSPLHPRLGVYLTKGLDAFIASVGREAYDGRTLPPFVKSLESGEEVLDALAGGQGLDLAYLERRTLTSYRKLKPGVGRGLEVVGGPIRLAPPKLVGGDDAPIDELRAAFTRFDWRAKHVMFTSYLLMRGMTSFSVPEAR